MGENTDQKNFEYEDTFHVVINASIYRPFTIYILVFWEFTHILIKMQNGKKEPLFILPPFSLISYCWIFYPQDLDQNPL